MAVATIDADRAMHSSSREHEAARRAWAGRPWMSFGIRVVAWALPVGASVLCTSVVSRVLPTPRTFIALAAWWIALSLLGTGALWGVDRLARRLLPLAALFKLSLVFPDSAPSRYRVALRSGTTTQLRQRVDEIKAGRSLGDTDPEAAEALLELVGALSVHDRLTRGHSERVRAYAQMIGEEMGLSPEDLDRLHWAGLVHDVGKLYVAGEILNKQGDLTDDEYDAIKVHPVAGAQLCAPLRGWLGPWVDAVGEHHERWDGQGYPSGLAGEEISLAARIVSVADVFDVITSARSYKSPKTSVEGRDELARCAGTQFDPTVVRAFLNVGLGRLRLVMGPLSWLAQVPVLNRIPLTPAMGAMASVAAAVGSIALGGLVHAPHIESHAAAHAPIEVEAAGPVDRPVASPPPTDAPPSPPPSAPAPEQGILRPPPPGLIPWRQPRVVPGEPVVPPTVAPPVDGGESPAEAPPSEPPVDPGEPVVPPPPPPPPPPDAPPPVVAVARDDVASTLEDQVAVISPLDNDDSGLTSVTETDVPSSGAVQILGSTLRFTPDPDVSGTSTFRYHAQGPGADAWAQVTVTVGAVNDAPSFTPGGDVTVAEDAGATTVTAWATAISAGPPDEAGQTVQVDVVADDPGLFDVQPSIDPGSGTLSFTPASEVNGATSVSVVLTDDGGVADGGVDTSAAVAFVLTITPGADTPMAADDAYATDVSTLVTVPAPGVLGNDSDHDGDSLVVETTPVSDVGHGNLVLFADGSFVYDPAPLYSGVDQFTYRVQDGTGRSAVATVFLTVDSGTTQAGYYVGTSGGDPDHWLFSPAPVGLPGPEPDHDLDGDPGLTVKSSGQDRTEIDGSKYQTWILAPTAPLALNGPVTLELWSSTIDFGPSHDVDYSIWLEDCAADGTGCVLLASAHDVHVDDWNAGVADWVRRDITFGSVDTTVAVGRTLQMRLMFHHKDVWVAASIDRPSRLVVAEANVAPVANPDTAPMLEDAAPQVLDVLANDVDVDLDPSTVAVTAGPAAGTAMANPDGTVTYTPSPDANGTDSFTYQVCDTGGRCDTATVDLTITAVNDAPTFVDAGDVTVDSALGLQTFAAWAAGILCGPADETTQVPTFTLVVSDPSQFSAVPTVSADGTLSIDPGPTATGTVTATVTLSDDGGTANGGVDTSIVHSFTITIVP